MVFVIYAASGITGGNFSLYSQCLSEVQYMLTSGDVVEAQHLKYQRGLTSSLSPLGQLAHYMNPSDI